VPNSGIVFGGSGANRTVTVTPALGQTGTTTITVTVSDGSLSRSYTFLVTVRPALILINGGQLPANSRLSNQPVSIFYIAKTETTLDEWQSVRTYALASGYDLSAGGGLGSDYPVTNVSWYDAVKWCNARSEQEGLRPVYKVGGSVYTVGHNNPEVDSSANGYRLPTEAEWEFAARGGVNSQSYIYSGSNDINAVAWYGANASNGTRPVATKQANELGLSDMSGNAREWCENWSPDNSAHRIVRGGSWGYADFLCRAEYRNSHAPDYTVDFVGFRAARSSVP
jgi:formylglycine-generating enzyme required for sulfatase activity